MRNCTRILKLLVSFVFVASSVFAGTGEPSDRTTPHKGGVRKQPGKTAQFTGGSSLSFDGVNDYVSIGNPAGTHGDFTWEAWIKTTTGGTIISTPEGSGMRAFFVRDGKVQLDVFNYSVVATTHTYNDGDWHHVAVVVTKSNNGIRFYVDGILDGDHNMTVDYYGSYTQPTKIGYGNSWFPSPTYFNGAMDEVRIWHVARTQAEIQADMSHELTLPQTNLAAYYKFNDGTPNGNNTNAYTLSDATGNGHTGNLNSFNLSGVSSNWVDESNFNYPFTPFVSAKSNAICQGNSIELRSTRGTAYQWYKNGIAISGATDRTILVSDAAAYTVTTTSGMGETAGSAPFNLSVVPNELVLALGTTPSTTACGTPTGVVTLTPSGGSGQYSLQSQHNFFAPGSNDLSLFNTQGYHTGGITTGTSEGFTVSGDPGNYNGGWYSRVFTQNAEAIPENMVFESTVRIDGSNTEMSIGIFNATYDAQYDVPSWKYAFGFYVSGTNLYASYNHGNNQHLSAITPGSWYDLKLEKTGSTVKYYVRTNNGNYDLVYTVLLDNNSHQGYNYYIGSSCYLYRTYQSGYSSKNWKFSGAPRTTGLAAGTYTYSVADNVTGCVTTASATVGVAEGVVPSPAVFTMTGSEGYCEGTDGAHLGLSGSTTGVSYQLYRNGSPVGLPIVGTGSAIAFAPQASNGDYTVKATNSDASCVVTMGGVKNVQFSYLPSEAVIAASGSLNFCEGLSVQLTASQENSYLWSTGETTRSISVAAAGTFSVTVFNALGCSRTSDIVTTTTSPNTLAVSATSTPVNCLNVADGTVTLTASGGSGQYTYDVFNHTFAGNSINTSLFDTRNGNYSQNGVLRQNVNQNGYNWSWDNYLATKQSFQLTDGGLLEGSFRGAGNTEVAFGLVDASTTATGPGQIRAGFVITGSSIYALQNGGWYYTGYVPSGTWIDLRIVRSGDQLTWYQRMNNGQYQQVLSNYYDQNTNYKIVAVNVQKPYADSWYESKNWRLGSSSNVMTGLAPGTHHYSVTDAVTGCVTSVSASVGSVHATLPVSFSVTGGGEYCDRDAGVPVMLSGSETGTTYHLYWNGTEVSSTAGTGSGISFGNQQQGGEYRVKAISDATGCTVTMDGSVQVIVKNLPQAVITPSGSLTFCEGKGVVLTASDETSYMWSNGATTRSINVVAAGTFSVTVTGANGCSLSSEAVPTTTVPNALSVSATSTPVNCSNVPDGTVTLTASGGSGEYNYDVFNYNFSGSSVNTSLFDTRNGSFSQDGVLRESVNYNSYNWSWDNSIITKQSFQLADGAVLEGFFRVGTQTELAFGLVNQATSPVTDQGQIQFGFIVSNYTIYASHYGGWNSTGYSAGNDNWFRVRISRTGNEVFWHLSVNNQPFQLVRNSYYNENTAYKIAALNIQRPYDHSWFETKDWRFGSSSNTITGLTPGTHHYVITDAVTGCSTNASVTVGLVNTTLPVAHNLTGGGNYCSGGAGVAVGLNSSETGVTYQLLRYNSQVASMAGTGAALSFGNQTADGTYTIRAVSDVTGCSVMMTGSVEVGIYSLPYVTAYARGNTTLCQSESLEVYAQGSYNIENYLWSNGATTSETKVSGPGPFTVTVTDVNGCSVVSNAINPTIIPTTLSLTATATPATCENGTDGTVTLQASGGSGQYQFELFNYAFSNNTIDLSKVNIQRGSFTESGGFLHAVPVTPYTGNDWGNAVTAKNNITFNGDFTIEQSFRFDANGQWGNQVVFGLGNGIINQNGWTDFGFNYSNGNVYALHAGGQYNNGSSNIAAGTWYDFKIERKGSLFSYFVKESSSSSYTPIYSGSSGTAVSDMPFGATYLSYHNYYSGFSTKNWKISVNPPTVNLAPGQYTYMVRDADGGCTASVMVTVPVFEGPNSLKLTASDIVASCADGATGSVTLTPGGGSGAHTLALAMPFTGSTVNQNHFIVNRGRFGVKNGILYGKGNGTSSMDNSIFSRTPVDADTKTAKFSFKFDAVTGNNQVAFGLASRAAIRYTEDFGACFRYNNGTLNVTSGYNWYGSRQLTQGTWYDFKIEATPGQVQFYYKTAADATFELIETISISLPNKMYAGAQNFVYDGNWWNSDYYTELGYQAKSWSIEATPKTTNLAPGTYIYQVTDATGCVASTSFTIPGTALVTATATVQDAIGDNCNGSVSFALGSGSGSTVKKLLASYPFSGTTLDQSRFQKVNGNYTENHELVSNHRSTYSDWNNTLAHRQIIVDNGQQIVYEASFRFQNAQVYFGLLNNTVDINQGNMQNNYIAAFYVSGNSLYAHNNYNGTNYMQEITANMWYDFRIVKTGSQQAYYIREMGQGDYTLLRNLDNYSGPVDLRMAATHYNYQNSGNSLIYRSKNWRVTTDAPLTGLCAGNYTYLVSSDAGCTSEVNFTVGGGTPSASAAATNSSCYGVNDGSVTVTVTGGTAPYQYSIDGENYVSSNVFSSLAAGTYTVTVKDANGLVTEPQQVVITQPDVVTATVTASGATTFCPGGSVVLTSSSATGNLWSNGASTQSIIVSAAGEYTVTVTQGGCAADAAPVTVVVHIPATVSLSAVSICAGNQSGITVSVPDGSSNPYTWTFSSPGIASVEPMIANMYIVSGISAGSTTITYTTTDRNGCTVSASAPVTIHAKPVISPVTGASVVCIGGNIQLSETTTGGSWFSGNPDIATVDEHGIVTGISTGEVQIYYQVNNEHDCVDRVEATITVKRTPSILVVSVVNHCNGTSVLSTEAAGTLLWIPGNATTSSITVSAPGAYSVTQTVDGCTSQPGTGIASPGTLPVVTAIAGNKDVCAGVATQLINTTPGGVWSSSNESVATVNANGSVTGVSAGEAVITYTVTNGQCSNSVNITVKVNASPVVNAVADHVVCAGSTVAAVNFSGTGNAYTWTNNNASIGLGASGSGSIGSFLAVNNSGTPVTATITVVPASSPVTAYIANYFDGKLLAVDPVTNTTLATMTVGTYPYALALTPDGSRVYVSNLADNKMSVVNTATNAVTDIPMGSYYGLKGIAMSPDGSKVYVPYNYSNKLAVISTATNTITTTITVGTVAGGSSGVAVSPDGSRVYVINEYNNNVTVIDAATNTVLTTVATGMSPRGIAVSPDGTRIYTANYGPNNPVQAGTVTVIKTSDNSVEASVPVGQGAWGVAVSPDNSKVYVTNSVGGNVTVIDAATNTVTTTIASGTYGRGLNFSHDGSKLYVAAIGKLVTINTADNSVAATTLISGVNMFNMGSFIRNGTGCRGGATTFSITVNPKPAASITAAGPTSFCTGGSVVLNANGGDGLTYQWKKDGTAIEGANAASYTATVAGHYTVTVTNEYGCATTSAAVNVKVNALPAAAVTVSVPFEVCTGGTVVLNANTGEGYTYQWLKDGVVIEGANNASYTASVTGSYSVLVTNSNHCSAASTAAMVTVQDIITPTVITQNITRTITTASGPYTVTVADIDNGSYDNCTIVSKTLTGAATFDCTTPSGVYEVVLHVTDLAGNTGIATATVTITNACNRPPAIICAPVIAYAAPGACAAVVTAQQLATGTDPDGDELTYTISHTGPFSVGEHTVTITVTDPGGMSASCTTSITVKDNQAPVPVVTNLPAINGDCSASAVTAPTATDNCAGTITGTTTDPLTYNTQGIYTITWTYNDGNGNTTSQTQTVVVKDLAAPVPLVTTLPNVTGQCAVTVTAVPTANDGCTGVVAATTTDTLTYNVQGTYTITWTYKDIYGNSSTQTQTVIVKDNIAPVPTVAVLPTITGSCSAGISVTPVANGCQDDCRCCRNVCHCRTSNCRCKDYDYRFRGIVRLLYYWLSEYLGDDADHGCESDNDTGTGNIQYMAAPKATDNCKGTIVGTTTDPLTYSTPGTHIIHWTFDDGNGNVTVQEQQVIVSDNTAPVPTIANLPTAVGQCSVTIGGNGNDDDDDDHGWGPCRAFPSIPTAKDNCAGLIYATTTDPLSYNRAGTYTIHWTYNDGNGNITTQTQTVIVKDQSAPKPMVKNLPAITGSCSVTVSTIPTAKDNCAGIVTATTADPLTYSVAGTYTIRWKYADGNGNTTSQTQTVTVMDNTKPVLNEPGDITIACNASALPATTGMATATDNCGTAVISYTDQQSGNVITRTWRATDASGNYATDVQKITIGASFAPVITSVPTSNTNTGGISTNLYIGYGAQSTTLQVCTLPSSGAPYTYTWTGNAIHRLNTTSSSAPVFTPNTYGSFTFVVSVTNRYGCTYTDNIAICVTDIRVPGTNGAKVYVCHTPSGKNKTAQTLEVPVGQVASHLGNASCGGNNNDRLGSCGQAPCYSTVVNATASTKQSMTAEPTTVVKAATTEEELKVTVMPNPSTTYFTLKLESKYETPVNLRVMDASGRVVDARSKLGANSTFQIGHTYSSGIYYAELLQGRTRKVVQLIKARG